MALSLTVPVSDLYFNDDGIPTETSQAQEVVEANVEILFEEPLKEVNFRQQYAITLNTLPLVRRGGAFLLVYFSLDHVAVKLLSSVFY